MWYDCLICGVSSAVERYPSKLDVVGSIPIPRSWILDGESIGCDRITYVVKHWVLYSKVGVVPAVKLGDQSCRIQCQGT